MDAVKVLIAEDEDLTRMMLKSRLERLGHQVVAECVNGQEAVNAAKEFQPDLAILDIKMPEMDGIDAAKAIVADHPCAILFLTGYSEDELVERAGEAGALAYLLKPFRKEDLGPALEIALRRFNDLQTKDREVTDLQEALETRKIIERAKGMLMDQLGLKEDEAFKKIHFQARNQNRKMRDVALGVIDGTERFDS